MSWYAIQTQPNHEQKVLTLLVQRELTAYLPLLKEKRRWSDRKKEIEFPLFRGYVFIQIEAGDSDTRFRILNLPGVLRFVAVENRTPAVIPDSELEMVRSIVDSINTGKLHVSEVGPLVAGCKVEILCGAFCGYRGLFKQEKHGRLLVSIDAGNRKVSAEYSPVDVRRAA